MKKWMLAMVGLVFIMVMTGCGDKKSFSMDQVDTRAYVMPDGDLYVEELFTYNFKGKFQGTTRYIDQGEQNGIEFFEAYAPPPGKKLGEFSDENLAPLNVKWDGDNDTYYIYNAANDEVKQVYYRYRINQAAVRYSDAGKLDYSFFKKSKQDIHHVKVDVYLPSDYKKADVHAYLHDRTGGSITTAEESAVHYENENLSKYGDAQMLVLFPQDQLTQMKNNQKDISLKQLLANEQKREDRMQLREGRMQEAVKVIQVLTIIFLLGSILYLLSWKRISAWSSRRQVTKDELEKLDPLMKTYILRKSKLKQKDFIAGLLSLRRRGLVTVREVPSSNRFLEEPTAPDTTLLFTFQGNVEQLNAADRQLVEWLFDEENVFRLDSVAGPTFKEKQDSKLIAEYRKKSEEHAKQFRTWSKTLTDTEPYAEKVRTNKLLRLLIPLMVIILYLMLIYLYYVDVASRLSILLTAIFLGAGGLWTCIKYKSKLWILFYHAACLALGTQIVHEEARSAYMLLVICSALFAALLPRYLMSRKTQRYRYALKTWRKELGQGGDTAEWDPTHVNRDAEHAVLLGVIPRYVKRMKEQEPGNTAAYAAAIPLLFSADILSSMMYTQSHLGFIASSSSNSNSSSFSGGGGGGGGTGAF
ncbi:DUF2207 domain-containing protein [Paenibacillus dokdonensis]|uniref:DUF2207 domain-containing protein n=1 Tax=Paenibacillus dokdonensis TaxID=2567944 RepID=A0ABU6GTS3_9BACL|nr:DUF2207 domain-containing protein [Paenibacillus dokdonensis]MEC0243150.1 DUF2207 domain-containing protein [Paenibacillus dokdonensis]